MKTTIISLLLFLTVNLPGGKAGAQNIWYVNRDATGNNTGRSWANAWNYLDSSSWAGSGGINWSIIQPGDTIYVSGGNDSTVYRNGTIRPDAYYTFSSQVVIAPAWQSGHNGDVYVMAKTSSSPWLMNIIGVSNVKIYGFTIYDNRTSASGLIQIGGADLGDVDSLQSLENCHLIGNGICELLYLSGSKITIKNCIIESIQNSDPSSQDLLSMSDGRGGHTIDGNKLFYRNNNVGTNAHRDGIQMSNFGNPSWGYNERLPITISNNLIVDTNPNGTGWNALIYSSGPFCNASFYVYNNIIVSRKWNTSLSAIWIGKGGIPPWTSYNNSLYILNNTIIVKGGGSGEGAVMITAYNHDTLIVKNNILIMDTSMAKVHNLDGSDGFPFCYKVFDYNYYGLYSDPTQAFSVDNALNLSWTAWQGSPYNDDIHSTKSTNTSVVFANKYGEDIEDYSTTTGRDAGVNLWDEYPFLRTDILGNERPQNGDWDIGALEFDGSQSNYVKVNGKIFLQGPFSTNSMSTTLTQSSLLPNSQPYNTPPWNYTGNESFSSGPSSTMVDWVLVELRSASNPSQVVARRAAVLKNDGLLLRPNGSEGVIFNNVDPGSYYIAIYHRNHLAIMSAAPVPLSSNSALYDFTTGMNKAYGQLPMVELVTGKYGMYATDGNADGIVNTTDRDDVWLIQNGNMGYLEGDFNMNSGVTVHDVNQLWNINNGAVTQVP